MAWLLASPGHQWYGHDDVMKWKHFPRYWPFVWGIHRSPELWCFLWAAPWINCWVNNRVAGDLKRHRAHYDVIVMICLYTILASRNDSTFKYILMLLKLNPSRLELIHYVRPQMFKHVAPCLWPIWGFSRQIHIRFPPHVDKPLANNETLHVISLNDIIWTSWHLKSPITRQFLQQSVETDNKENTQKALHYWPFVRGFHRWMTSH